MTDYSELKMRLRGGIFTYGDERAALAAIEAQEKRIAELEAALNKYKEDELLLSRDGVHFRKAIDVVKEQSARIAELEATITAATIILAESGVPSEDKNEDAYNVLTDGMSSAALNGEKG